MSQFAPAPHKPDSRIFASYPMPAKIDLINERPRRESLVEQELETRIGEPLLQRGQVSEQRQTRATVTSNQMVDGNHQANYGAYNQGASGQRQPLQQQPQQRQCQGECLYQQPMGNSQTQSAPMNSQSRTTTTVNTNSLNLIHLNNAAQLAADLADKEAKLMVEINNLHQRPYSPFQVPPKINLTSEQVIAQKQVEHAPLPRPYSRASSTRSTSADLQDKEAKLLQQIEEMEKKPFNPQRMVIEREQWFEYPEGNPNNMHLTDSKRRVKDFCSLPSYMYANQDRHTHEENLPASALGRPPSSASSVQTTIIRSPKREINNKSPLPFAFDNFSTKGVRGNIASVGAVEPDRPRPPIYPIIKRSPSPNMARG